MNYPNLMSPLKTGKLLLKNRILMPAMHTLYPENGGPSERFNEYYWRRAEGGAGLIVVGACRFDQKGARMSCMSLAEDRMVEPWKAFTAGMKERDCPVAVQLYHAGRYLASEGVPDGQGAISPSATYTSFTRETPRAMTLEDIDAVIKAWAEGARRAREAGFDAVEISGSAGYLISQFLSPLTNLREDEYGGSFEKRCRFPLEVIRAVRRAVGDDYTVLLRYSAHTLVPDAGGSDECLAFAKLAAREGIDMLDLTGGWHESRTPQLTQELPQGALGYLAAKIREEVDITVCMANRMNDLRQAETAIALGAFDMVGMGRPLVAEPDLPKHILNGAPERIRPCLACNQGCLAGTFFEKPIRCLSNGLAGREYAIKAEPAENTKKILIVGGGPAGMECALRAARRGHDVQLWEKEERLGGQMKLSSRLPARETFGELLAWYEQELELAGVLVRRGKIARVEDILAEGFEEVVLANGRKYKEPVVDIKEDAVPVYTMEQLLTERPVLPKTVAVIGGSFVGMECARYLLREAALGPAAVDYLYRYGLESDERLHAMQKRSGRELALFERGRLAAGYEGGIAWPVYADLNSYGAKLFPKTEVLAITAEGVLLADGLWPCEAVLLCPGTLPDRELAEVLEGKIPCHSIGNAAKPGRAIDAIEAGCALGCTI